MESPRGSHRILANHRVQDEQDLVGLHLVTNGTGLGHKFRIYAQSSGGIDNHHVIARTGGQRQSTPRHIDRVAHPVAGFGGENGDPGLFAHDLQLVDRVGTLQVRRDQQDFSALFRQPFAEFPGQSRFTSTLQAGQHEYGRAFAGLSEMQFPVLTTQNVNQLVVDDFHNLLGRVQSLRPSRPISLFLYSSGEILDDLQGHISLNQGAADIADGGVNVGFLQLALLAKVLKRFCQAVLQIIEHTLIL